MRPLLILLAMFGAAPALAQDASDYFSLPGGDYSACLVGHAVIVVQNQQQKDPMTAMDIARSQCKPVNLDEKTISEVSDYADEIVEQVAGALNK